MPLSILRPSSRTPNRIGALIIEATLVENHSLDSTVTEQPVENGANVSDHIITKPPRVTIDGFISNTPVKDKPGNNAQNAFEALYNIRDAKELVTVVTGFKVYDNMAIISVTVPKDSRTGDAIRFNVELLQVRISSSNSTSIFGSVLAPFSNFRDQAQARLNLGRQTATVAMQSVTNKASSFLGGLF